MPPEDVSTGRDGKYGFPKIDCAAADSGADEMNDLIFRPLSLPPDDSAVFGLDYLIFRQRSFPPQEFAAGGNTAADACDAMKIVVMIFRLTNLLPDEFSAGRNGDYIWPDLWTEPSVCNRPVTGSHGFGSSHRLERCCLWRATLPVRGSFQGFLYIVAVPGGDRRSLCPVEFPRCYLRTPLVSRASYDVDVPVHSRLCRRFLEYVFTERNNYDLVIILDPPWCRHPVWPDGVFAELDMSLYDPCLWECRQLLAFDPAVLRTPPFFRLILTFSHCVYDFLRKQELGTGGSPITDRAVCFHEHSKQAMWNVFAPDFQDTMELWALRPHVNWVKVICVCLHEFLRLNVMDIHEGISEKVSGAISTSAFLLDVTVMSSSGVIVFPSDVPAGQPQPLTTGVSCTDTSIVATPFVVPPSPDIEQPCRQLQDSPMCRTPDLRQPWLLWNLSAIYSAHTPPQKLPESSRPTGDALLPPLADDCLCPSVDTPDTVGRCEPFPGSEYPSSLPACATVRLVLSAGPSGASDWVGSQDLYHTAGGITSLCIVRSLVRPFCSDDSPTRSIRRYESNPPRYAQVSGVRRSAAYRWKPGIGITASSCSALRWRGMSEGRSVSILSAPPGIIVVQLRHTCSRSRMDVGYCYSPLQLDDYTVVI